MELALALLRGQLSVVSPDEEDRVLRDTVGHLDRLPDAAKGGLVASQIVDFVRQVLRDVAIRRGAPVDVAHQRPGVRLDA